MARRASWENELSLSDPYCRLLASETRQEWMGSSWYRCNTAVDDSMEDMPSTVCVSGIRRILVDVMVAQLSRVQDRAAVLQRSTRQELEEEISSCLLIHLGESSLMLGMSCAEGRGCKRLEWLHHSRHDFISHLRVE